MSNKRQTTTDDQLEVYDDEVMQNRAKTHTKIRLLRNNNIY